MDTTLLPSIIVGSGSSWFITLDIDENNTLIADFESNLSGTLTYRIGTEADQIFADDPAFFSAADSEFFTIDADTGILSFINAPDFENPLNQLANNFYQVDVVVSNGTESVIQAVDVKVNDVEPENTTNSPVENLEIIGNNPDQITTLSIDENIAFVVDINTNADDNPVEEITFRIYDSANSTARDSEFFTVDANTGILSFINAPDFENPLDQDGDNIYEVDVEAVSSSGMSTIQQIDIQVNDIADGDSNPTIDNLEILGNNPGQITNLSIDENIAFVADINTNADGNSNEDITFSILGSSNSVAEDLKLFTIDPSTGVLSFINAPDFENPIDQDQDNVYQVDIEAISSLGGSTIQLIDIRINDVSETNSNSSSSLLDLSDPYTFLAIDNNNDGLIDRSSELFGNEPGFANLADFDVNNDGLISPLDSTYDDLSVWQDINENGITEVGELISLGSTNITSISNEFTDVFPDAILNNTLLVQANTDSDI